MKLAKLPHEPGALVEFFQQGLETLGAVCERTWYDRLQVVADGRAARVWNTTGDLVDVELQFPPPERTGPRDAEKEVFPGCPLTFRLAEALGESTPELQRLVLQTTDTAKPPPADVAERVWRLQFPGEARWWLETPFQAHWHFSLLVLVRCEVQAIDQRWSIHRSILALPDGTRDEELTRDLELCSVLPTPPASVEWPPTDPAAWHRFVCMAMTEELEADLSAIRVRQEHYLRRELDRIDDYFAGYARELQARLGRQTKPESRQKLEARLAAAQQEHERRRLDQVQRHEIRVCLHLDALRLLAERAWQATVTSQRPGQSHTGPALFIPRLRRWRIPAAD